MRFRKHSVNPKTEIESWGFDFLIENLRTMLVVREFETLLGQKSKKGFFQTPIHLAIGQEAISVGVSSALTKSDVVFGNHRSHGHYLSLGGDPGQLFSEILGNLEGCSGGKGGSMHITAVESGFYGSMPIVAGTIPIAVGASLALKQQGKKDISVAYFGDGATEEGVFYEALNLASNMQLPILFVCENNVFSSHMHLSLRRKNTDLIEISEALAVYSEVVDGNDLMQVATITKKSVANIRAGDGPSLILANTYRQMSHVGFDEDLEVGLNRKIDLEIWQSRDPIGILKNRVEELFPGQLLYPPLEVEVKRYIQECWSKALDGDKPSSAELTSNVYWSPK